MFPTPIISALPSVSYSLLIMFTLILIFAAAWTMFWVLAWRSTDHWQWVTLRDWGKQRGFRQRACDESNLPEPLQSAFHAQLAPRVCLTGKKSTLIQVDSVCESAAMAAAENPPPAGTWNLLIRETDTNWRPTALRPAAAKVSALDLFSLSSFPLLGNEDRFVVYGTRAREAAVLSRSVARGLLPPDIGLLLHGKQLLLDFSTRPFDTIEFDRMIAVADQLIRHLGGLV